MYIKHYLNTNFELYMNYYLNGTVTIETYIIKIL